MGDRLSLRVTPEFVCFVTGEPGTGRPWRHVVQFDHDIDASPWCEDKSQLRQAAAAAEAARAQPSIKQFFAKKLQQPVDGLQRKKAM